MVNWKKSAALLLLSAVLSAAVAGCGGGDGSEDAPAPAPVETTTDATANDLTKDELIQQGDDICAEVNAAVGTINSSTTADASVQETQVAGIYSGMAQSLDELGTPTDGDAPTDVIEAAQALADSGSADGATALSDFQTAATEYGFTTCADAPSAPSSSSAPAGTDPSATPDAGSVPAAPAPAPAPAPAAPPATAPPASGGGVAPAAPPSTGGGSSGGSSSGGISPG